MSFDVLTVKRVDDENVEFGISCSCKPSGTYLGDKASYNDSFDHIDGVFVGYDPEGDVVFYDVAKKIMRLWITDDDGEECIIDLNTDDVWMEYSETLKNLNTLFEDHWPSLGEIVDVLSLTV